MMQKGSQKSPKGLQKVTQKSQSIPCKTEHLLSLTSFVRGTSGAANTFYHLATERGRNGALLVEPSCVWLGWLYMVAWTGCAELCWLGRTLLGLMAGLV